MHSFFFPWCTILKDDIPVYFIDILWHNVIPLNQTPMNWNSRTLLDKDPQRENENCKMLLSTFYISLLKTTCWTRKYNITLFTISKVWYHSTFIRKVNSFIYTELANMVLSWNRCLITYLCRHICRSTYACR